MRLSQGGIQLECSRRRLVRLRENVPRRQVAEIAEGGIGIGESGVGPRIGRVCLDRPREVLGRLRSEEHTSELQSRPHLVCRLLLEKKKKDAATYPVSECF